MVPSHPPPLNLGIVTRRWGNECQLQKQQMPLAAEAREEGERREQGPVRPPSDLPSRQAGGGNVTASSLQQPCLWTQVLPTALRWGRSRPVTEHGGSPGPGLSAGFLHQLLPSRCSIPGARLSQPRDFRPELPSLSSHRPASRDEGSPCSPLLPPLHLSQALLETSVCGVISWCLLPRGLNWHSRAHTFHCSVLQVGRCVGLRKASEFSARDDVWCAEKTKAEG